MTILEWKCEWTMFAVLTNTIHILQDNFTLARNINTRSIWYKGRGRLSVTNLSSENNLKEPTEKPLKKKCGEEEEIKNWHSLEINPGPLACATSALNIYMSIIYPNLVSQQGKAVRSQLFP